MSQPPSEIPDFQSLMLPVLIAAKDGEVRIGEVVELLADSYSLSYQQRAHLLPSGKQSTFANRVHWAKSYLGKAALVEATKRGHFRATPRGLEVLLNPPPKINIAFLQQFPEFQTFKNVRDSSAQTEREESPLPTLTPDEDMRRAHSQIERDLAEEMLTKILSASPAFFEQLVVNLGREPINRIPTALDL